MSPDPPDSYLTVKQVADHLGMTPDGVHKLISRGHLRAVKRSARKTLITRPAFDAYVRRHRLGELPNLDRPNIQSSLAVADQGFMEATGVSAADWLERWKHDEFEDSIETAQLAVRATSLVAAERMAADGEGQSKLFPALALAGDRSSA